MNAMGRIERISSRQLDEHLRQPHIGALKRFLTERGYASHTVYAYADCVAHFSQWAERTDPDLARIDESVVAQFLNDHLPHCKCGWPTRSDRRAASAALGHLLLVLRTLGITAAKAESITPVEEELRRFDEHMEHVRGLAPGTRRITLRIVRELLRGRFRDRPVVFSAITPEQVRRFFSRVSDRYRAPTSATALAAALRGYFRFRALAGDPVHALIGILSYPANWQQASLPKTLADEEIDRLLKSLDSASPFTRRSAAIVRCAVDLGLRSGEIAALSLDDINWRCGTLTVRNTKSRREQVLPLPEPTGRAIAAYLKHERPKVAHRGVFVRRMAPPRRPDRVR